MKRLKDIKGEHRCTVRHVVAVNSPKTGDPLLMASHRANMLKWDNGLLFTKQTPLSFQKRLFEKLPVVL
jgi:hypothetical protein